MVRQADDATESITLREHLEALRVADEKFATERDRRYKEVADEREKALKIKETADLAALELAREIQTYKDEKANELRSQIERERGNYATRQDLQSLEDKILAMIEPLSKFVASQQGQHQGAQQFRTERRLDTGTGIAAVVGLMVIIGTVVALIVALK